MVAGHTLMHILGGFFTTLLKIDVILGFLAAIPIFAISILELGISFLQAYVFLVLVCIYLKESLNSH